MILSARAEHAVQAMLELALDTDGGLVPLSEISERQDISVSYLEQLFALLRREGLVHARRGPGGGYVLSRPADEISVTDVIEAIDGPISSLMNLSKESSGVNGQASLYEMLDEIRGIVTEIVNRRTIADLIDRNRELEEAQSGGYIMSGI